MIKKFVIAGVVVATLGALVTYGGRPFSYARTWVSNWKQSAEDNVPLDLKIQNAREEVAKLGPDIRKCMHLIAEQQVEVEDLQQRIAERREKLTTDELAIRKMRADLKSGETHYVYSGQSYRASEVRKDLALRFERFRTFEDAVKRDVKILDAKRKTMLANERRLEEMLAAKKQLEVQLEQLEARWKTVQAAEAASDIEFDDSHLSKTKALIRKLDKELDVRVKVMAAEGKVNGHIPVNVDKKRIPVNDVTKEIDEYFTKRGKDAPNRNDIPVVKNGKAGAGL